MYTVRITNEKYVALLSTKIFSNGVFQNLSFINFFQFFFFQYTYNGSFTKTTDVSNIKRMYAALLVAGGVDVEVAKQKALAAAVAAKTTGAAVPHASRLSQRAQKKQKVSK